MRLAAVSCWLLQLLSFVADLSLRQTAVLFCFGDSSALAYVLTVLDHGQPPTPQNSSHASGKGDASQQVFRPDGVGKNLLVGIRIASWVDYTA